MNLTVEQEPVGIAYYESEIYLNSKPTGVLQTSPTTPRVGEDFEIYLNAFDVETDANIEYLKIKIIDNKDNERAEFEYINQGANFNLIFEVEYAGEIILEYSLIDESGNKNESINSVNVIGWADIFISDIKISGSKEKGAKHQIVIDVFHCGATFARSIRKKRLEANIAAVAIQKEIPTKSSCPRTRKPSSE